MALFKSKEEKQEIKQQKEQEKIDNFIERYNLGDIDKRDFENLLNIAKRKSSLNMIDAGNFFAASENDYLQQIAWQQILMFEQNLLMIKQLDRLNKNLEKLIEK